MKRNREETADTQLKLIALGRKWYAQAQLEEAKELFDAARALSAAIGDRASEGQAWTQLGRIHWLEGEPLLAERSFSSARRAFIESGSLEDTQTAMLREAFVAYDGGDLARATSILNELDASAISSSTVSGMLLGYRGNIARAKGEFDSALQIYASAEALLINANDWLFAATFVMDRAVTHLLLDQAPLANDDILLARQHFSEAGTDPMLLPLIVHYEVMIARALGDIPRMEALYGEFDSPPSALKNFLKATHSYLGAMERDQSQVSTKLNHLLKSRPPFEHARITSLLIRNIGHTGASRDDSIYINKDTQCVRLAGEEEIQFTPESPDWRILSALLTELESGNPEPLSGDRLISIGWPAEKLSKGSAKNRLHVALSKLRKNGLRSVLHRDGGGYTLSTFLRVRHRTSLQRESE